MMFFWCPFFNSHPFIQHSNIGAYLNSNIELGTSTLEHSAFITNGTFKWRPLLTTPLSYSNYAMNISSFTSTLCPLTNWLSPIKCIYLSSSGGGRHHL